jgi:Spy/CpxP family protein refolding chaperone
MGNRSREMHSQLTAEQRAELDAIRADSATPESRVKEDQVRELVTVEFPPRFDPALAKALAGLRAERERKGVGSRDM